MTLLDDVLDKRPILWLHIGVPRTGTTSIQNSFAANRAELEKLGVRYVTTNGSGVDANNLVRRLSKPREHHAELIPRIHEQLAAFPSSVRRNYVLSSELFFNRGVTSLFEAFKGFPGFEVRILLYLRRQDFYHESLYCQMAKSRQLGTFAQYMSQRKPGPNYEQLIASLAASGAEIVPRLYEKGTLIGGDTVSDFLHLLGLDRACLTSPIAKQTENASLPLKRLQLVQELLSAGLPVPPRERLSQFGSAAERSKSIRFLGKAERRAFLDQVSTSNEAVRQQWFPDRETLFDLSDLADTAKDVGIETGFTEPELLELRSMFAFLSARQNRPEISKK